MEVRETSLAGVSVLHVAGDIDHSTASVLDEAVRRALGSDGHRLLFDLTACPYLDSGGLAVLLFAVKELRQDGWVGVVGPDANVLRLLGIVGLTADPSFKIFASHKEASRTLAGDGS